MTIAVGVGIREVAVPPGTSLAGFAGRLSASTGVHDPTSVRALVLDAVGIVAVDVCALHEQTCARIEAESDLPLVVVAATHTHSGPSVGCGRVGPHEEAVHEAIVEAAIAALRDATSSVRPATVAWTSVQGLGVAKDRRHLDRDIDPPLVALRFTDEESGGVVATLVSYPCHPVVLDATNTLVTSDYIHPLRAAVETESGGPCVFLTGAAGDVNTGHAATASFGSSQAPQRTFSRASELGQHLAHGLDRSGWTPVATGSVHGRSEPVTLGFEPLRVRDVAVRAKQWRAELAAADPGQAAVLRCWIDWAERWRPDAATEPWVGRVSCVDLGDAALVMLPGEPFLWAADALMRVRNHVLVAGYSDGVAGYLPTSDAYPEGGYEVEDACMYYAMPAPFARGSLEQVANVARQLLEA